MSLKTRNGLDWTAKFRAIAEEATSLPGAIIDGEIAALDENGVPDFAALQAALSEQNTGDLVFYVFDLLFEGADDLRALCVGRARKERLEKLLATRQIGKAARVPLRGDILTRAEKRRMLRSACKLSLEGIVSESGWMRAYQSGRTNSWTKAKCAGVATRW